MCEGFVHSRHATGAAADSHGNAATATPTSEITPVRRRDSPSRMTAEGGDTWVPGRHHPADLLPDLIRSEVREHPAEGAPARKAR